MGWNADSFIPLRECRQLRAALRTSLTGLPKFISKDAITEKEGKTAVVFKTVIKNSYQPQGCLSRWKHFLSQWEFNFVGKAGLKSHNGGITENAVERSGIDIWGSQFVYIQMFRDCNSHNFWPEKPMVMDSESCSSTRPGRPLISYSLTLDSFELLPLFRILHSGHFQNQTK